MPDSIRDILRSRIVPVSFERTIGLIGATSLGVGALMGAGIYVLIGLAADRAGPAVVLSYLACGLLSLLSVGMFAEFSRRVPAAGGGYTYAYQALGSLGGFITGWLLALGSVFACAMYALGFAYYLGSLLPNSLPPFAATLIAVAIVAFFTVQNARGLGGGARLQYVLTWGNMAVLVVLVAAAAVRFDAANLSPVLPNGFGGAAGAVSIIYVSFFGYQLIANNSEEVIAPGRTIPRAMFLSMGIALLVYVAVAVVSVASVPWRELAASPAPLVEVATRSLGRFGWVLVAAGGVLASGAALSSTLISQARQIFAMGRDRFLPSLLGRLHAARRTPQAALWIGGLATGIAVASGNVEFIARAANFCFIVSMVPVSLALRQHRKKHPSEAASGLLRRYLPEAALVANLALLVTLDWVSILFGLQLLAVGAAVFVFYSRKREVRSRAGMSVDLSESRRSVLARGHRILVPMANPRTQDALFAASEAMLSQTGGEIVVLSIVVAPGQLEFRSALSEATAPVEILERSRELPRGGKVRLRPIVRVSRNLAKGIVHAAEEEGCQLIVMGYSGVVSAEEAGVVDTVLARAKIDAVFLKIEGEFAPRRIAVSLGSSLNLDRMVQFAGAVADRFAGEITFLSVLPEKFTHEQRAHADKVLVEAIQKHAANALYRIEVVRSDQPLELLVERSAEFDLLIVGTTKVGFLERAVVGSFSAQLAERARCSIAVVRAVPPIKRVLA